MSSQASTPSPRAKRFRRTSSTPIIPAGEREQLRNLVSKLTNSKETSLDNKLVEELKRICKISNDNVGIVWDLLKNTIDSKNSQTRLFAAQLCNLFFLRSAHFRKLLLENFTYFKANTVATKRNFLPAPESAAKLLSEQTIENIETWEHKFGDKYSILKQFYEQMKLEVKFPSQIRLEQQKREEKLRKITELKINRIKGEMREITEDVTNLLTEIDNGFEILTSKDEQKRSDKYLNLDFSLYNNFEGNEDSSSDENEEEHDFDEGGFDEELLSNIFEEKKEKEETFTASHYSIFNESSLGDLRSAGVHGLDYELNIEVDLSSKIEIPCKEPSVIQPLVQQLNGSIKILNNKFLPVVVHWIESLGQSSVENDEERKLLLSNAENYRTRIHRVSDKFERLDFDRSLLAVKTPSTPRALRTSTAFGDILGKRGGYDGPNPIPHKRRKTF